MHLSVKEVELKIREHEKSRYFFEIFVKNINYIINNYAMCITLLNGYSTFTS